MTADPIAIAWMDVPEAHDYDAAHDYLTLHFDEDRVHAMVKKLKGSDVEQRKAKDVIRASGLPLLPEENRHVVGNLARAQAGKKLSPILLVRTGSNLLIADGYHRACAAYYASEDTTVSCVLVSED